MVRIALRDFDRGDFDRLIGWITSPEALRDWAAAFFAYPLDHTQLERYLGSAHDEQRRRRIFTAMELGTDRAVGHIELSHIWPHLSGRISRVLVGDLRDRRKGLGESIVRCLVTKAFDDYAFDRIDLGVSDRNRAAIACYGKVGFVHVGTWPQAINAETGVIDVYWMTLRRDDFASTT